MLALDDRYDRQAKLPEVGEAGQNALRASRVLVVGAGGLGCPALQYLVGAGVGHISLYDPDTVSISNLHRQTLFTEADVNRPKAVVAREKLIELNRDVEIEAYPDSLGPAHASDAVAQCDVVLDCADNIAATYSLSDACFAAGRALISASALGLSGYVGGFCGGAPSVRAVFPDLPSRMANCNDAGVLGPVVGMLGALQAQMALTTLLGLTPSPLGRLWRFDALTLRGADMHFSGAPEPAVVLPFIDASQVTETDRVIELRDTVEAPTPAHPRAERCTPDAVGALAAAEPGQRTVFCCLTGLRAWRAAQSAQNQIGGEYALLAAAL